MSLFKQNNEAALLNKLAEIKPKPAGWAVAILKNDSLIADQKRELFSAKAVPVYKHAMQTENIIPYFCNDRDIYFLLKDKGKLFSDSLKQLICQILPQYREEDMDFSSFFEHYLLSESFDDIYTRVEEKEAIQQQEKQAGRAKTASGKKEFIWIDEFFSRASADRRTRTRKQALIVEDDEIVREPARTILKDIYTVSQAEHGKDALEIYNKTAPDIVFLDINMPGESGLEILKKLVSFDPDATIVMFSGSKTSGIVSEALKAGAKGYVIKPFRADTLIQYAKRFSQS